MEYSNYYVCCNVHDTPGTLGGLQLHTSYESALKEFRARSPNQDSFRIRKVSLEFVKSVILDILDRRFIEG